MRRLKKMVGTSPPPKNPPVPGRPPPPGAPRPPERDPAAEIEDAAAFQEELALLREEQTEAGQVDLLLVHLDLREIGVDGEIGGQVLCHAVLDVEPDVAVTVVEYLRVGGEVGPARADQIRFDLERAVARRHVDAGHGGGRRDAEQARAGGIRHRGQIDRLVLVVNPPPELQTPDLRAAGPIPERFERNLHLGRPAALEPAGAHVPDRIPVAVGVAFVGDLKVEDAADRVDLEGEPVAAVVEGVEGDAERLVVDELERVALHLVGDPLRFGRRVPQAGRDVDVLRVKEDPRLGPFGAGLAFVGELLDEPLQRLHGGVRWLVQRAIHVKRGVEAHGADRGASRGVARERGGRFRGRRAVDESDRWRDAAG